MVPERCVEEHHPEVDIFHTLSNPDLTALPLAWRRVEELAQDKDVSMAQIAIAWMLAKPGASVPIVGSTSLKNLEDILGACFNLVKFVFDRD